MSGKNLFNVHVNFAGPGFILNGATIKPSVPYFKKGASEMPEGVPATHICFGGGGGLLAMFLVQKIS